MINDETKVGVIYIYYQEITKNGYSEYSVSYGEQR
jgi:hypothetical protein